MEKLVSPRTGAWGRRSDSVLEVGKGLEEGLAPPKGGYLASSVAGDYALHALAFSGIAPFMASGPLDWAYRSLLLEPVLYEAAAAMSAEPTGYRSLQGEKAWY